MNIEKLQRSLKEIDHILERTEKLSHHPLISFATTEINQDENLVKIGYAKLPLNEVADELQGMQDAYTNFRLRLMAYRTKLQRKLDAVNELLKQE